MMLMYAQDIMYTASLKLEGGGNDWICKPSDLNELSNCIDPLVSATNVNARTYQCVFPCGPGMRVSFKISPASFLAVLVCQLPLRPTNPIYP